MLELPDFSPLAITQDTRKPKLASFAALDHLIMLVPAKRHAAAFKELPNGAQLEAAFRRAGARRISARLNNRRSTGATVAPIAVGSRFQELTWARKLVADALREGPAKLGVVTAGLDPETRDRLLLALVAAAEAAAFALPRLKREKASKRLKSLRIYSPSELDWRETQAAALGNNIARWFTALPPNRLTAASYRHAIEALAAEHGLKHEFLGEKELAKRGAGAFLAVSQGNAERDAGILRVEYRPEGTRAAELALVGKGILFDTGGTNLKPFKSMLDMHTDMQGSAVVLGCLVALASLEVPFAIDAWFAITENRLSATAYKSQDVVVASNGTSIQVIHTDAEGRMVLADALALAADTKPALIIDYATLTGSCVAALTDRYSGVFTNRPTAHELLARAGSASGERVWPFPMDEDYDESLQSDTADIKQCAADGYGDHILAARFLSRFVPASIPWVHVDLSASQKKGGLAQVPSEITGFGVGLTLELLLNQASSPKDLVEKLAT